MSTTADRLDTARTRHRDLFAPYGSGNPKRLPVVDAGGTLQGPRTHHTQAARLPTEPGRTQSRRNRGLLPGDGDGDAAEP